MSLSALKRDENVVKTPVPPITKEASKEKMDSLKDLLAKATIQNNTSAPTQNTFEKKVETTKIEEPKIVIKKEEPKEEVIAKKESVVEEKKTAITPSYGEAKPVGEKSSEELKPAFVQDFSTVKDVKKEEEESSSWQKRKAKKEVPEDILRKVLE